jgi:hypothetical protein
MFRRPRRLVVAALVLCVGIVLVVNTVGRPSVWVDNRSSQVATVFVTDDGSGPAAWYIVPAHSTVHLGSAGLGGPDVRANVLGWGHEAYQVDKCSPGHYEDTLFNVPRFSSIELSIDPSGQPTVKLASEPTGLTQLAQAPLGNLPEASRCP